MTTRGLLLATFLLGSLAAAVACGGQVEADPCDGQPRFPACSTSAEGVIGQIVSSCCPKGFVCGADQPYCNIGNGQCVVGACKHSVDAGSGQSSTVMQPSEPDSGADATSTNAADAGEDGGDGGLDAADCGMVCQSDF